MFNNGQSSLLISEVFILPNSTKISSLLKCQHMKVTPAKWICCKYVFCVCNQMWCFSHDNLAPASKILGYTHWTEQASSGGSFYLLHCGCHMRSYPPHVQTNNVHAWSAMAAHWAHYPCIPWWHNLVSVTSGAKINSAVPRWGWGGGGLASRKWRFYCEVVQGTNWKVNLLKQSCVDWHLLRNWTASVLWTGKWKTVFLCNLQDSDAF